MEQAQYLMLMRKRQFLKSNFQALMKNSFNESSWEEKAFAEDSSGNLAGCIWPPRSYSCSFCKREFRSAQALGGHMNVHRKDRARLKQSLTTSPPHQNINNNNDIFQHQNYNIYSQTYLKLLDSNFPSDFCNLDYDIHPKSASSIVASTVSSSRVSAWSTTTNSSDHQEKLNIDQNSRPEAVKNTREEDFTCLSDDDIIETELFMGFNQPTSSCGEVSCKRPKMTSVSTVSFLIKPCSNDRYWLQPEVTKDNSGSMEGVDLELRLGELPKVK